MSNGDDETGTQPGLTNRLDRLGRRLMEQPAWFIAAVFLALSALPVAVWLDLNHISRESLVRQASDLNAVISDIRSYYARNVIGRVTGNGGKAVPTHNYEEVAGGIPIPATLSLELGNVIGERADTISYRFVSDAPFKGRAPHNLTDFEKGAIERFKNGNGAGENVMEIGGSLLNRHITMAVPVVLSPSCVSCHNTHPDSPSRDWKTGDVRGIQSITIDQPIAANLFSFKFLLAYLAIAGLVGLAFALLQWRQAMQFAGMNKELEEANGFLATISMKISKYLSPQVYKSIFSGERDAVIATERKKLTIFFSDIKDFTVTTERLQPEELTALLNEYFTEMAAIAEAHGATVDKFIGDAILAFFGDPETKGAREDALACVNMAIAMQNRLVELGDAWRRNGIEAPFLARMGINTGYCNVGNFGSKDRMDYTLIGAEANLAARLESIAEPGGIVMSYETYSLVRDDIDASPLPPITLKGISREIIPYSVNKDALSYPGRKSGLIEANTDSLKLRVDLDAIADTDLKEIESALAKVQSALQRRTATAALKGS